jgi:hypothetical protein
MSQRAGPDRAARSLQAHLGVGPSKGLQTACRPRRAARHPCRPRPPVHHHVAVAVLHPRYDLLEEVARLVLGQPSLLDDVVKQLATLGGKGEGLTSSVRGV